MLPSPPNSVEIVALSYSVIKWLSTLPASAYPHQIISAVDEDISTESSMDHDGVEKDRIRLAEWAAKIETNFEAAFWIPSNPAVVERTGFYKDTVGQ